MKKNFRRGGGHGPNASERKSKNPTGPVDESTQDSKSKGKARKDIRNARSLSEVLGGGGRSGNSSRGQRAPERSTRRDMPSDNQGDERTGNGPKNVSKKLTYIMNFQAPQSEKSQEGRSPSRSEAKSSQPQQPHTSPVKASHSTSNPAVHGKPSPTSHGKHSPTSSGPSSGQTRGEKSGPASGRPVREPSAPSDFRWPKDRVKSAPVVAQTEERASSRRGGPTKGRERIQGIVKRHPDGFGFLIPDNSEHPDVYISRQSMVGVMTNDRVEVSVYMPRSKSGSRDERLAGEISRVLSRSNRRIVGKFLPVDQKYGIIQDENRGWGVDLRIPAKDSMNAKEGDMIAVEVTQFPDEDREFTGRVVALMGTIEEPLNDVMRVVHASGIPTEFSATALSEARRYGGVVTEAEMRGREDLTQIALITIDGATARDFDDAIFTEQTANGFRLIVGIADVSHYVKPGSTLDQEAYELGTSTYFPNFVVPMLPEELSNELCSLKPHVKRLTFACEMNIDFEGEVKDFRFFEAFMESKARVTYGEAQEVLDGSTPPKLRDVSENIRKSADLAKILMQKRFREGSLDLEIPETQVVVDTTGESVDIIRSERLFAHRLIEELMLITNVCTARFLDESKIPGIYRVHEEPDPDNVKALQRYLWNFGANRSVLGGLLQKKITKALQSMDGKPEQQILSILTLRTMKQAHYSEGNVGHFGLGFSHYSHFTSPIRRYPDLIAHRLIKSQLYPRYRAMQMTEEELASATTFLSACEQRSTKAERQVISIKKARFIRKFIGQEFDGIISSVAKFGCFVMLRQYDIDGLVKIENLGPDRFIFDDENLRLIGPRIGVRYTIGDLIRVRVAGADPEQGRVDFELAQPVTVRDGIIFDEDEMIDVDQDDREQRGQRHGARQRNTGSTQQGSKKGKGFDASKRGKTSNDSRRVRKERVSKRRGKN